MDKASQNLGFGGNSNSSNNICHWSTVQQATEYKDITIDSPAYSRIFCVNPRALKRKWVDMAGVEGPENPLLTLGLGHSPSSSDNSNVSSATACTMSPSSLKETDEESSMDLGLNFELCLGHDTALRHKKSHAGDEHVQPASAAKLDLQLSLSTGPPKSAVINASTASLNAQDDLETVHDIVGKGSEPSAWVFGHSMASSSYASEATYTFSLAKMPDNISDAMASPDVSSTITASLKSPAACTSGLTNPPKRNISTKNCQFPGCEKGARGASGYCIAHGGGRRCQKPGCQKGAEGRTIYCKAHGGGRRCQFLGCTKSAEGRTDHCIAHGGGHRCSEDGCSRAARGKSGLCIRHGGGKRCQKDNCKRSAEGYSGLCISHGGGRRCQFPECTKGAQGSTKFCKAHGGGKRCTFLGCTKGAEGSTPFCKGHGGGKRCSYQGGGVCPKSVHGGTQYCVAHGGGKRCAMSGCTKSARGRTEYCVRHGGGKRCRVEGCEKSAQGSTDFCKAHGGGKRCSWGQAGSSFGAGGPQCDKFARSKTGLCAAHSALVEDHCVHGGGSLGPAIKQFAADNQLDGMEVAAAAATKGSDVNMTGNNDNDDNKDEAQALQGWSDPALNSSAHPPVPTQPGAHLLMEGRVHGRGLLGLLSGKAHGNGSSSENGASTAASASAMRTWM